MEIKRSYRIVASDLDGTFLSTEQKVSRENMLAVEKMAELGVQFVPTTGRTLGEIPEELMSSPAVRYIITSDGAAVWDKNADKFIITRYFSRELVGFVLDTADSCTSYVLSHENGKNYYDTKKHNDAHLSRCRVTDYFRTIIEKSAFPLDSYDSEIRGSDKVEMFCMFFGSDEELLRCKRIFLDSGKLSVSQSSPYNLEVYVKSAGKGNTLGAFAEALGVDICDVIAVGDSNNDRELVRAAGLGLAMENASDELKDAADKTICHCDKHCAKYILENFII
ncbi:MAG: HAD family phosphatase [Clostridia bacterium]|nr:HAD family phosphatase [Clostridia bacterium]